VTGFRLANFLHGMIWLQSQYGFSSRAQKARQPLCPAYSAVMFRLETAPPHQEIDRTLRSNT